MRFIHFLKYGTLYIIPQLHFKDISILMNADLADVYIPLKNITIYLLTGTKVVNRFFLVITKVQCTPLYFLLLYVRKFL